MPSLRIMGVDPALRNIGYCIGSYNGKHHQIHTVGTIRTKAIEKKYKVESHFEDAVQMYKGLKTIIQDYQPAFVFYEYPIGSKSAAALISYAFTVMMMAALKTEFTHIQFIGNRVPVIKKMFAGNKDAEKRFIINRAYDLCPDASGWKISKQTNEPQANSEHMADAVAAYYVGAHLNGFFDPFFKAC